jgi:hypothetical protein
LKYLFDNWLLGGGLGLDDGLDAVLSLVDDRLDVVLASHLDRPLVDDLLLHDGRVVYHPLGLVDHLVLERQVLHAASQGRGLGMDHRVGHRGGGGVDVGAVQVGHGLCCVKS